MANVNISAGTIAGKVMLNGVMTLQNFAVPAQSVAIPADGTHTIAFDYKTSENYPLANPQMVLFSGLTSSTYPNAIPLHLVTQLGGIITHCIDKRLLGGVNSNNIQSGAVNSTHIASGVIAIAQCSDVTLTSLVSGQTLEWNGSVWTNTTLASAAITVHTISGSATPEYHIVKGQVTATTTSTTITFTGTAIFASTAYFPKIFDITIFTIPTITAMTASSITFTSVIGHVYNYEFSGV